MLSFGKVWFEMPTKHASKSAQWRENKSPVVTQCWGGDRNKHTVTKRRCLKTECQGTLSVNVVEIRRISSKSERQWEAVRSRENQRGVVTQKPREETLRGEGSNGLFTMLLEIKKRGHRTKAVVSGDGCNKNTFVEVMVWKCDFIGFTGWREVNNDRY